MDLDRGLVSAILTEGKDALLNALNKGITVDRLQGEGQLAFAFLYDYYQRFGELPVLWQVEGKTQVYFDVPSKSIDFFIEEITNRGLYLKIKKGLEGVNHHIDKIQIQDAYMALERLVSDLREDQSTTSKVESLFKVGPEIKRYYLDIKEGKRGIQTPWDGVNEATYGFWPEDLVIFVARLGVGKTWTAVLTALHAWEKQKKRVLFITTEVSRMRIGMRFLSARERLGYGELTHGKLAFTSEARLFDAIEELYNAEGFYVVGGDFDFQIESVIAAIETAKPDLVVVDGVYLLRVQGSTRVERMANAFDEMKRIAKRKKVPVVITTQFNREAKKDQDKKQGMSADNIAMSDVGGWNADLIFGLSQTEEQRKDNQMFMEGLKVREGARKGFLVNWNFERMDFSQLVVAGGGGGDADEKGSPSGGDADDEGSDGMPF